MCTPLSIATSTLPGNAHVPTTCTVVAPTAAPALAPAQGVTPEGYLHGKIGSLAASGVSGSGLRPPEDGSSRFDPG